MLPGSVSHQLESGRVTLKQEQGRTVSPLGQSEGPVRPQHLPCQQISSQKESRTFSKIPFLWKEPTGASSRMSVCCPSVCPGCCCCALGTDRSSCPPSQTGALQSAATGNTTGRPVGLSISEKRDIFDVLISDPLVSANSSSTRVRGG